MADDRAAEIVAATGLEPALTRCIKRTALLVEILSVSMECITRKQTYCIVVIRICASKVTDIDQYTEIGMVNRVDKSFNTVGILGKEAVVFDTGSDSLGFSIFCNFTVCSCKNGKNVIEASPSCTCNYVTGSSVVAESFAAVCFSNVNKALNTCYFRVGIAVEEVSADTEAASFDAYALAIIADILCIRNVCRKIVIIFGGFNEINAFTAKFFNFIDTTLYSKGTFLGVTVEAIKTDAYFHYDLYLVKSLD